MGGLEIDWGKNNMFANHSKLFLRTHRLSNTKGFGGTENNDGVCHSRYSSKLDSVKDRLELLGYTLDYCRELYDSDPDRNPEDGCDVGLSFDQAARVLSSINIGAPQKPLWEHCSDFDNFDPYIALQLLSQNTDNLNWHVVWSYGEVVEGGWIDEDRIYVDLDDAERYLVVTEGKTDSTILRRSLEFLRPDVQDFFRFVDMKENYPFTGTGNLANFCQGLARIRIQNKILVVFDNDTSGRAAYRKIENLDLPANMRVALLPDMPEFRTFSTLGPSGERLEDINGKAVSIEHFLDLSSSPQHSPKVRWTSYDKTLGQYQGELVDKEVYFRDFMDRHSDDSDYDWSNLRLLWNYLIKRCTTV